MGRIVRAATPARSVRRKPGIGQADAQAETVGGGNGGDGQDTTTSDGDGYLQRVAKYVPAEIVAFFIFVNTVLSDAIEKLMGNSTPETYKALLNDALDKALLADRIKVETVSWIVLLIGLLLIPLYLFSQRQPGDKQEYLVLNIVMAMLAFPIWAYAVDAVAFMRYHDSAAASILLAVFTIVSGAISPNLLAYFKKPT